MRTKTSGVCEASEGCDAGMPLARAKEYGLKSKGRRRKGGGAEKEDYEQLRNQWTSCRVMISGDVGEIRGYLKTGKLSFKMRKR